MVEHEPDLNNGYHFQSDVTIENQHVEKDVLGYLQNYYFKLNNFLDSREWTMCSQKQQNYIVREHIEIKKTIDLLIIKQNK